MIQETEDDLLDQSLRDTFSDFDLPPSGHIWTGIEGHLAALPGPPRPVPLLLMLPIVGLVGVGIGWLLPRPALTPPPPPAFERQLETRTVSQQRLMPATIEKTYIIPRASTEALALAATAKPVVKASLVAKQDSKPAVAASSLRVKKHSQIVPKQQPLVAATDSIAVVAPLVSVILLAEDLPSQDDKQAKEATYAATKADEAVEQNELTATAPRSIIDPKNAKEWSEPSLKTEGMRERRPEYRVPTHRLAERGRGLRRIQNSVVRHWQHLFGPRRARVAPASDF